MNNLKQVGLAFRVWPPGSIDSYPMGVSTNFDGTQELIAGGHAFVHFRALSNELSSPKVLVCPDDKAKVVAMDFYSGFSDANVSYFVGVDAYETDPQMFLTGDRNLALNGEPLRPGLFTLTTNNPQLTWTKAIHNSCGNVGLADGSVQFYDSKALSEAARFQGQPTNRLVIP